MFMINVVDIINKHMEKYTTRKFVKDIMKLQENYNNMYLIVNKRIELEVIDHLINYYIKNKFNIIYDSNEYIKEGSDYALITLQSDTRNNIIDVIITEYIYNEKELSMYTRLGINNIHLFNSIEEINSMYI